MDTVGFIHHNCYNVLSVKECAQHVSPLCYSKYGFRTHIDKLVVTLEDSSLSCYVVLISNESTPQFRPVLSYLLLYQYYQQANDNNNGWM